MIQDINKLFHDLLTGYSGGISNTSTKKYQHIKEKVAEALLMNVDDIYATGSSKRMSNLDTRLPQGNQRGQNAPLALVFVQQEVRAEETVEQALARITESFSATCDKFVSGEERGTTFDGIMGFVQLNDEPELRPLRLVHIPSYTYALKLQNLFPGVSTKVVVRQSQTSAAPGTSPPTELPFSDGPMDAENLLKDCKTALAHAKMRLADGLLDRFVASLLTKRLVILAGLSGSGKTQLALGLGKWLEEVEGQVEVVAVGADWTSNENIVGYRDALDQSKYRRPTNGSLDLLLRAYKDPSRPYFLILDEMNLSHVERYFSDILSALESGQPLALHAADEEIEGVPPRLLLPQNVFVIGTVNVDETTYMFSPKVLDRANVIEFKMDGADLKEFLADPAPLDLDSIEGMGLAYGPHFVRWAKEGFLGPSDPARMDASVVAKTISDLFDLLAANDSEFGYRTAFEIRKFLNVQAEILGESFDLQRGLDAQILQRIMPKLHGSEKRLRPILNALEAYASQEGYKWSREKLGRMQTRLKDGFASFLD